MAAELQPGDASLGLADQIKGQEPSGEWQLGGLHDRASCECGLKPAGSALLALQSVPINQAILVAAAARTAEAHRPACLLQSGLTVCLHAIRPLELRQGKTYLELDAATHRKHTGIHVPDYAVRSPCAERAGSSRWDFALSLRHVIFEINHS